MTQQHNGLGRYTALLSAFTGALGERDSDFSGIERAGETLTPVIDLWSRPEWAWLRDERRYWHSVVVGAIAAERSGVTVRPPAGVICCVEYIRSNQLATIRVGSALVAPDSEITGIPRDARLIQPGAGNDRNSRTKLGLMTQAIAAFNSSSVQSVFVINQQISLDFIVTPSRELQIVGIADATAITVDIGFWEREALPGELV